MVVFVCDRILPVSHIRKETVDGCAEGGEGKAIRGVGEEFIVDLYGASAVGLWGADGGVCGVGGIGPMNICSAVSSKR